MPTSIVLRLTPPQVELAYRDLDGAHIQAAFLDLVREVAPEVAMALHEGNRLRGYAIGVVPFPRIGGGVGRRGGERSDRVEDPFIDLRIACLDDALLPVILEALIGRLTPGGGGGDSSSFLHFGEMLFSIREVFASERSAHPWVASVTEEELERNASSLQTFIPIDFVSPTLFQVGDVQLPLPVPALVFGGLYRRWGAAARGPLPFDAATFEMLLERHLTIGWVRRLKTARWRVSKGTVLTGFFGEVVFQIVRRPPSAFIRLVNLLADAAFFTGVGKHTTQGMGMIRRHPERRTHQETGGEGNSTS